jgi:hypothetical protein
MMKVSYSLVLSLLLSVIPSLSKVKQRQRINGQRSPGSVNCNANHQPNYTSVFHSLTLWNVLIGTNVGQLTYDINTLIYVLLIVFFYLKNDG